MQMRRSKKKSHCITKIIVSSPKKHTSALNASRVLLTPTKHFHSPQFCWHLLALPHYLNFSGSLQIIDKSYLFGKVIERSSVCNDHGKKKDTSTQKSRNLFAVLGSCIHHICSRSRCILDDFATNVDGEKKSANIRSFDKK